jgi:hypothetical protein
MKKPLISLLLCLLAVPLLSTSARLMSMGNLQFTIEDNINRISQYDFGKNPAGLFSDEDSSFADLDMLYATETSRIDTMDGDTTYTAIGNAIPHELLEYIPTYNRNEFGYVPFMKFPTNRLYYVKRNKSEKKDIWGNTRAKDAYGFGLTYGKLDQEFTGGSEHAGTPSVELTYSRLISNAVHMGFGGGYLFANYEGDENFEKASLSAFTLTPGFVIHPHPSFSIGSKMDYHLLSCSFGTSPNTAEYSGNAFGFSGTSIVTLSTMITGATIAYKMANANEENENFSVSGLDLALNPRIVIPMMPVSVGGILNYESRTMLNETDDNDTLYHNEFAEMQFGAGPVIKTHYFLAGFEYIYSSSAETEIFAGRDSTKATSNTYRIGAEIKPLSMVFLRGGYEHTATEQTEPYSRSVTKSAIGGGFGTVIQRYLFDFGYNYITTDEENIQKITTDHVFIIGMRYSN